MTHITRCAYMRAFTGLPSPSLSFVLSFLLEVRKGRKDRETTGRADRDNGTRSVLSSSLCTLSLTPSLVSAPPNSARLTSPPLFVCALLLRARVVASTHCSLSLPSSVHDKEVTDLEKKYHSMKSSYGAVNRNTLAQFFATVLPPALLDRVFAAFPRLAQGAPSDVAPDTVFEDSISVREFLMGLSVLCRGSSEEKLQGLVRTRVRSLFPAVLAAFGNATARLIGFLWRCHCAACGCGCGVVWYGMVWCAVVW